MASNNQRADRRITAISYATGSLQGLAFSLLPALATLFTATSNHISSAMYGALFVPETIFAVIGAFGAPVVARRLSPFATLRLGLIVNIVALASLIASAHFAHAAYPLLMIDTTTLGLGFGLCNATATALVETASSNPDRSITILNLLTGLGTSLTPAIIAGLRSPALRDLPIAGWQLWPILMIVGFASVLVGTLGTKKASVQQGDTAKSSPAPMLLWIFTLCAVLYGTCEGSFGSWATAFSQEHGASSNAGDIALTGFWLALTAFRLLASIAPRLVPQKYSIPPLAVAAAVTFTALPLLHGNIPIVAGYLCGGLSCGVMYPYLIANALDGMPQLGERVTGYLTGGMMIGQGLGSFVLGASRASFGLDNAYRVVAAVAVALAIMSTLALKRSPPKKSASTT